jgi:hypothetical protein
LQIRRTGLPARPQPGSAIWHGDGDGGEVGLEQVLDLDPLRLHRVANQLVRGRNDESTGILDAYLAGRRAA